MGEPLRDLGVPDSVILALDPILRSMIEAGYERQPDGGVYPAEPVHIGLIPDPGKLLSDFSAIAAAFEQTGENLDPLNSASIAPTSVGVGSSLVASEQLDPAPPTSNRLSRSRAGRVRHCRHLRLLNGFGRLRLGGPPLPHRLLCLPARLPSGERLPTILNQTRYFRSMELRQPFRTLLGGKALHHIPSTARCRKRFVASGYAWVDVDVRGTGASYGGRISEWSPDEIRDGAEIVDWIVRQSWSSGKVGALGSSYSGAAAEFLLANAHPAVHAVAPRFSLFDANPDIASTWTLR